MKRWIVLAGIAVLLFLVVRLVLNLSKGIDNLDKEREWYAEQLQYDFSATIDTVIMETEKVRFGKLIGHLTRGKISSTVEDSLGRHLIAHKLLRLNQSKTEERIEIIVDRPLSAKNYLVGDSMIVDSATDRIIAFRSGKKVSENKISEALRARSFLTIDLE